MITAVAVTVADVLVADAALIATHILVMSTLLVMTVEFIESVLTVFITIA
jgi:hypothetical protein